MPSPFSIRFHLLYPRKVAAPKDRFSLFRASANRWASRNSSHPGAKRPSAAQRSALPDPLLLRIPGSWIKDRPSEPFGQSETPPAQQHPPAEFEVDAPGTVPVIAPSDLQPKIEAGNVVVVVVVMRRVVVAVGTHG